MTSCRHAGADRLDEVVSHLRIHQGHWYDGPTSVILLFVVAVAIPLARPGFKDLQMFLSAECLAVWAWGIVILIRSAWGRRQARRRIIAQRLCFECGYSLLYHPVDQRGHSVCPECGNAYQIGDYSIQSGSKGDALAV